MADRALGYIRVSTGKQAKDGDSLDAQRARLGAAPGLDLVDVVVDAGKSASSLRRPGLQGLLARLRAGEAVALACTKVDRLTRVVGDLEQLLTRHFDDRAPHRLALVDEPHDAKTPIGRMTLRILTAVNQLELERDDERTRAVIEHKRATGQAVGAVPLGFRREGDLLVPDASEQATLARAAELAAGGAGLHEIARQLTAAGHATKRGGRWTATTVRRLLARKPS